MQATAPVTTPPLRHWTARRVILVTLTVAAIAAGFYLLTRISGILFIVFIAAVLATAFRPAVLWMGRRGIPQRLGIILMYLALVLVVLGVLGVLVPLLINQGGGLVKSLPSYYAALRKTLTQSNILIVRNVAAGLPAALSFNIGGLGGQSSDNAALLSEALSATRGVAWVLFGTISVFVIAFFWVLDRDQILRATLLLLPLDKRDEATELWGEIETKVGGYVRGTAILCVSIGVMSAIVYFLIGIPSALIISVLAATLEAIPYIGPFLTAAIAIVVTLSQAPDKIIYVIVACIALQQFEGVVLVPRVMDKAVGVNAIVTLLGIAAFGSLLGVLGAILAIPLAAVVQVLLDHWLLSADTALPAIHGRDKVAALRYQAQDLAADLRDRIRIDDTPEADDIFEERIETLVGTLDQILVQLTPATTTVEVPSVRGAA
ncbi:MAG: AI-2E family transporter [Herpetosiphonaceae bacterium]|nr:AI-2E family transporter [Herpetosiphonaceae bacterium]